PVEPTQVTQKAGKDPMRWRATVPMLGALLVAATTATVVQAQPNRSRPNIVVILADDIGYGDLSCYGATKVKSPNLDRLAAHGMRFLHAHSAAAVRTPSRYALLTGQHAWRPPPAQGILSAVPPPAAPLDRRTA